MILIPTKSQFKNWSLPSKATYLALLLGIFTFLISIIFYVFPNSKGNSLSAEDIVNAKLNCEKEAIVQCESNFQARTGFTFLEAEKVLQSSDTTNIPSLKKAHHHLIKEQFGEAISLYQELAINGDEIAQYYLAMCYINGYGTQVDTIQGVAWLHNSADKNCSLSATMLGYFYHKGIGMEQSYEKAFKYYQAGSRFNEPYANQGLGFLYAHGLGVKKNYKKAFASYLKAAEQGNAEAMYNLGQMYFNEQGVEFSFEKKIYWLKKSAQYGYELAIEESEIFR